MANGSNGFSSYAYNLWRLHWSTFVDELIQETGGGRCRPSLVGPVIAPQELGKIELPELGRQNQS